MSGWDWVTVAGLVWVAVWLLAHRAHRPRRAAIARRAVLAADELIEPGDRTQWVREFRAQYRAMTRAAR